MALLRPIAAAGAVAVLVAVPLAGVTTAAEGGTPSITNTETVNAKLDASGKLDVARIYDQIAIEGSGTVSISNPVSTSGLRNLDGFSGFTVNNGAIDETVNVSSSFRQRAVSDFTKQLPVGVKITYLLDGKEISPSDLVGKSGRVEFKYRVENLTGESQDITVKDGAGRDVTKPVTVYEPLAGSLDLTVPPGFVDVQPTGGGVAAGDGKGGTQMSFNLTLIPPLGDPVAEFGFTATVTNAVVPPANLTIVPVVVSSNPTITGAADSYKGGAATGGELTQGAQQIDANLLKLSAGAGQLLSGLIQLNAGASQLASGLTNNAVPGADKLATGASQLSDGLNNTAVPGSKQLAEGADQLSAGLNNQLSPGAEQLAGGLKQLQAGLLALPATVKATPEYKQLIGALSSIMDQIGDPTDSGTGTALGALNTIAALASGGTSNATTALTGLVTASNALNCASSSPSPACPAVFDGIDAITNPANPTAPSATDLLYQLGAIGQISAGLKLKLYDPSGGTAGCLASPPSGCGAWQALQIVQVGIGQLVDAIAATITGDPHFQSLVAGGSTLASGVNQAAAGSTQVADGANQLATGLVPAADGAKQIADGADQLSSGLTDAANGASQIEAGLGQAADGVPQIRDGAKQLSTEGTQKLIAAGNSTALDFGEKYAVIQASAERTADGGLPYGAPTNATVKSAAYSIDIAGASGESSKNTSRGVAALLIGAGAAGAAMVLGRRFAL